MPLLIFCNLFCTDVVFFLTGKTLIFGTDTGVNLDGHVMLSCGEVRHNWLDVGIRLVKINSLIRQSSIVISSCYNCQ